MTTASSNKFPIVFLFHGTNILITIFYTYSPIYEYATLSGLVHWSIRPLPNFFLEPLRSLDVPVKAELRSKHHK